MGWISGNLVIMKKMKSFLRLNNGVYKITNLITNDLYIGSSACKKGFLNRFEHHKHSLRRNLSPCLKLQNSWNKYGEDNFSFEIIEVCSLKKCIEREQYWLDLLKPSLNILTTAGNSLGAIHTETTKNKISEKLKGVNIWSKGRKLSKEHKINIGKTNKGRKLNEQTKKRMSELKIGSKNPRSKKVICIELDKIFESVRLAAKYLRENNNPNASHSAIASCCRNERYRSAYGFKWKYL